MHPRARASGLPASVDLLHHSAQRSQPSTTCHHQEIGKRLVLRQGELLADRGALRPGLSASEARDLLWTLNSLAVHDLLVLRLGWSPERFRDWPAAALARELLPG